MQVDINRFTICPAFAFCQTTPSTYFQLKWPVLADEKSGSFYPQIVILINVNLRNAQPLRHTKPQLFSSDLTHLLLPASRSAMTIIWQ